MLDELRDSLDFNFSQKVNGGEDIIPQAIANIEDLQNKLANFKKFFAEMDMREPDSVGYVLRDIGLTEKDLGV